MRRVVFCFVLYMQVTYAQEGKIAPNPQVAQVEEDAMSLEEESDLEEEELEDFEET